jgi:predicted acylesterase/phospholipase RssA
MARASRAGVEGRAAGGREQRIGLALAGGGPEGAVYEIGALRALDEALDGIDFNHLEIYVGVSAGSFIAAALANQLDTAQLCRAIVSHEPGEHPFNPETFLKPAGKEWLRRARSVPRLLTEALWHYARHSVDTTLAGSLTRLGHALPVGVFDNEPLRIYLENVFAKEGRTDDFRELEAALCVVAADLDSGQAVRFGEPGFDHVPISRAVQASTALPGLYPPVEIDGRFYVDGVLLKTLHASVALDAGVDLILCVNPIVSVDTVRAVEEGVMKRGRLVDRGLPTVLSQTFRTLIQSRLDVGMRAYERRYEGKDVALFQPRRDDYRMFFTNIFSFEDRVRICEHAYAQTLRDLRERRGVLEPMLARHGVTLREDVLADTERDLWSHAGLRPRDMGRDLTRRPDGRPRKRRAAELTTERLAATLDRLDRLVAETG